MNIPIITEPNVEQINRALVAISKELELINMTVKALEIKLRNSYPSGYYAK
jgi:hypothetical protein